MVRRAPEAISCPRVPRIIEPTAAAKNAVTAAIRAFRIILWAVLIIASVIPIAHPFPYISAHVIYAKAVGCFLSYRMCLAS